MALCRLELRPISRRAPTGAAAPRGCGGKRSPTLRLAAGRSIAAAVAYRSAGRVEIAHDGERRTWDYRHRLGVVAGPVLAPTGAPSWMRDRQALWARVEADERRKDALLAREAIVTLPLEVPFAAAVEATQAWAQEAFVARGMVVDVCAHRYGAALELPTGSPAAPRKRRSDRKARPERNEEETAQRQANQAHIDGLQRQGWPVLTKRELAAGDPRVDRPHVLVSGGRAYVYQPHCHLVLTTRSLRRNSRGAAIGFGAKERAWAQKPFLYGLRESWAAAQNAMLAAAGVAARVDSRSKRRRLKNKAGPGRLDQLVAAARQPPDIGVHLDGGEHAARRGSPPATPPGPGRSSMSPRNFNAERGKQPVRSGPLPIAADEINHLHEVLTLADVLIAQGVRFFRRNQGSLGYATPDGSALPKYMWRQFAGLHEATVLALEAANKLCADAEKAKAEAAESLGRRRATPVFALPEPAAARNIVFDDELVPDRPEPSASGPATPTMKVVSDAAPRPAPPSGVEAARASAPPQDPTGRLSSAASASTSAGFSPPPARPMSLPSMDELLDDRIVAGHQGDRPVASAPARDEIAHTSPTRVVSAPAGADLRAQLEPRFELARKGQLAPIADPQGVDWVVEEFRREAKRRRLLEAAIKQLRQDLCTLVAAVSGLTTGAFGWFRRLRERLDAATEGCNVPHAIWETESRRLPVLQDPTKEKEALNLCKIMRNMPEEYKINRADENIYRMNVDEYDKEYLHHGLKVLVGAMNPENAAKIKEKYKKHILANKGGYEAKPAAHRRGNEPELG